MKNVFLSIALAATLALAGCSGFFVSQNPGGGGGGTDTGYFFVLNGTTNYLVGLQVASNKITSLTGASEPLNGVSCVAISPNNNFLYVGTGTGIFFYSIDSTGKLTLGSTTPLSTIVPQTMQVDSSNSWLVFVPTAAGELDAIPLNTSTGGLATNATLSSTALTATTPNQLVITPDNKHIFVTLGISGTDEVPFNSSPASGTSPLGTKANTPVYYNNNGTTGAAIAVTVDSSTKMVYISETLANPSTTDNNSGGIRAFAISSTANTLTAATDSPFASGGLAPAALLIDHSGDYLYIANRTVYNQTAGNVYGYAVAPNSTGSTVNAKVLTNAPFTAGTTTIALAEDNSHTYIMAINQGGTPDLNLYSFDSSNLGSLDGIANYSTGTDPTGAFAIAAAN